MKRNLCICCGATAIGYVFAPSNQICRICRDYVLTYLCDLGIAMIADHPFISELCVDSHYVAHAHYTYHHYTSQTQKRVIASRKILLDKPQRVCEDSKQSEVISNKQLTLKLFKEPDQ